MPDDAIWVARGVDVFIATDFVGNRWTAATPKSLLDKLDIEGIARSRLHLDRWEDGPHDHALSPREVAELIALLR